MANKTNKKFNNKPNNRNYDKRNNGGPGSDHKDEQPAAGYVNRENDPSWYNVLNTLVTDVTKIPFNTQVGRTLAAQVYDATNLNVPGILALDYMMMPGIAKQASDGVNIAATGLFQTIRKDLSTYASYASADVMMYVLACDSIIAMYNYILRFFGMANLYSSINYNYSTALLISSGMEEDHIPTFRSNFANYMAKFNNLIYKASTLIIPNQFSIMKRHAWLFSNVFIDGKDARSQIYLHKPYGIHVLNETEYETGTALKFIKMPEGGSTMDEYLNLFDAALEAMRNSDSMNKIAADIRRALASVPTWSFSYVTEGYMVTPTYSQEVLSQIENTVILPEPVQNGSRDIKQSVDHNIILFDPQFNCSTFNSTLEAPTTVPEAYYERVPRELWNTDLLINMHWLNPSSDDIAVATRNMNCLYHNEGDPDGYSRLRSAGSDMCGCTYLPV